MSSLIQAWTTSLLNPARSEDPAGLVFVSATRVRWESRTWVYFGGSDYFRLSWEASVRRSFVRGAERWGHDVAASRLTTGNHPRYGDLEKQLADWLGFRSVVLCASGFQAPTVAAQCMGEEVRHVFVDRGAHACLVQAAAVCGRTLKVHWFDPRKPDALRARIRRCEKQGRVAIWTEGFRPRVSALAPLRDYLDMLSESGVMLVDDAHGLGLLGETGGGALEVLGIKDRRILVAGTLSKALGCGGGFVAGPGGLRKRAFLQSTVFAGATPVGLPYVEAASTALVLLRRNLASWQSKLEAHAGRVRAVLSRMQTQAPWKIPDHSGSMGPVISLEVADRKSRVRVVAALLEAGVYPSWIRYPGGPEEGYIRLALSSGHSEDEVRRLCDALSRAACG